MTDNQEWAIARFREDSAKFDPPFYSTKEFFGRIFIWMSVNKNVGWYWPEIKNGEMIGIREMWLPPPDEKESKDTYRKLNYAFKWISPKQQRKIVHLISIHGSSAL